MSRTRVYGEECQVYMTRGQSVACCIVVAARLLTQS